MMRYRRLCSVCVAACFQVPAWAQADAEPAGSGRPAKAEETTTNIFGLPAAPLDGPLVTDRPDFTESTEAVPFGHAQLESGYTFTYDREDTDRVHDHTAPEMLWRIGLFEKFELRVAWAGYSWTQSQYQGETRGGRAVTREDWDDGANDMNLGFKYKLWEQDGLLPHFGVIGEMSVPSGSAGVSSGDVDPGAKLLWAYDLADGLALAGNVNFASLTEDDDRFFQTANSVSLAASLTDWLGTYFEYFGFYPNSQHTDCAHYLNGGFTFLITDNLQLDVRTGFGLNEEADDLFSGVGFSYRF